MHTTSIYTSILIYMYKFLDKKQHEQLTSKCEYKVVRKFSLETEKLMHNLCPTNRATKTRIDDKEWLST